MIFNIIIVEWNSCSFNLYINDWVQDCSKSSVLAMELLQSCTKPSIFCKLSIRYIPIKVKTIAKHHIAKFQICIIMRLVQKCMNPLHQQWNYNHLGISHISRVSCQKGPTRHAYAWQIGPFWQDILDMLKSKACIKDKLTEKWTFMEAYQRHAAVIENVFYSKYI